MKNFKQYLDQIHLSIPLLIRLLEYAREDAKTDMDLHKVVENMIQKNRPLDMDDYDDLMKF